MSEAKKSPPPASPDAKEATPSPLVAVQDTSKEACGAMMVQAAADLGGGEVPQGQLSGKLAVCRFFCNALRITDPAARKAMWVQFRKTPGWFGANASSAAQVFGWRQEAPEPTEVPNV